MIHENFDLALRMGDLPDDRHLSARRLAWFGASLFASPGWVATQGQLDHPDQLRAPGSQWRALTIAGQGGEPLPWQLQRSGAGGKMPMQRWQGLPAARMLANSPAVLLQMAQAGVGLALVGDFFAAPYVRSGELVRVLPDWRSPLPWRRAASPAPMCLPPVVRGPEASLSCLDPAAE